MRDLALTFVLLTLCTTHSAFAQEQRLQGWSPLIESGGIQFKSPAPEGYVRVTPLMKGHYQSIVATNNREDDEGNEEYWHALYIPAEHKDDALSGSRTDIRFNKFSVTELKYMREAEKLDFNPVREFYKNRIQKIVDHLAGDFKACTTLKIALDSINLERDKVTQDRAQWGIYKCTYDDGSMGVLSDSDVHVTTYYSLGHFDEKTGPRGETLESTPLVVTSLDTWLICRGRIFHATLEGKFQTLDDQVSAMDDWRTRFLLANGQ